MHIEEWHSPSQQTCRIGKHSWSVARLINLSSDLEVMEIPLKHINSDYSYDNLTLRGLLTHMKAVHNADLSFPIILDEDGIIMDGRHRLMKAAFEGLDSIKAVRFASNPPPCSWST